MKISANYEIEGALRKEGTWQNIRDLSRSVMHGTPQEKEAASTALTKKIIRLVIKKPKSRENVLVGALAHETSLELIQKAVHDIVKNGGGPTTIKNHMRQASTGINHLGLVVMSKRLDISADMDVHKAVAMVTVPLYQRLGHAISIAGEFEKQMAVKGTNGK
jgi:hypothetical protein